MTNEIKEFITREDVYNIAVPIAICMLGWLLPLLKSDEGKLAKKWMCHRQQSAFNKYRNYFLVTLGLGLIFLLFNMVIVAGCAIIISELCGYEMTFEYKLIFVSVLTVVILFIIMIRIDTNSDRYQFVRGGKLKTILKLFLHYVPFVCSIWIWGLAIHIDSVIINGGMTCLLFSTEIIAAFFLEKYSEYEYLYATLYFADGKEKQCPIEKVKQVGSWIVVKDDKESCEIRYRREDLVRVKYSNN